MAWLLRCAVLCTLLVACGPARSAGQSGGQDVPGQSTAPATPKLAVLSISEDPKNFWDGINGGGGSGARELGHLVNQYLAILRPDGTPEPRLLAELPSVDRGTWKLNPDGTMEVTYKLRPDANWHDGTPFSADDMVFSWEVGRDPAVPNGNQSAVRLIQSVTAVDAKTAVINWGQTYPFADRLEHREFYPLPKHLLETAYRTNKESFISQPYFTDEYVGTGPFKVSQWDHGSYLDLVANDNYFLGRPKLDRIRVQFIADPNTVVANLRAGTVNAFFPPGGPEYEDALPLQREWSTSGRGTVLNESVRWTFVEPKKNAAAQPADLTDPRVRQAILMAIDRQTLAQATLGDLGVVADSWVHPRFAYYPQVKDGITQYPLDPRRAAALLTEVGWTPGSDGIVQKNGARFQMNLRHQQDRERDAAVVRENLKTIGVDAQLEPLTRFQLRDAEARADFTGVEITNNPMGGLSAVRRFATDQTPTAANRYAGTNRGAYSDPEWDSIGQRMRVTLEDNQRLALERDLLRVFSAQLPALPMYFEIQVIPVQGLKGVVPVSGVAHTGNIMHTTNAHEWEAS